MHRSEEDEYSNKMSDDVYVAACIGKNNSEVHYIRTLVI